jgi:hypothetical protein
MAKSPARRRAEHFAEPVRQEVARGLRRGGELFEHRVPVSHASAHAHDDEALVEKVAPLPHSYDYRSPCFRDLQTQNAYLRGQLAKALTASESDAGELEYYKGQVHELTVHRAVLHKENERLLEERKAVEAAAARNAAQHAKHVELAEEASRLRSALKDAHALAASLRDELRIGALKSAADEVRSRALEAEVRNLESELRAIGLRHRTVREEATSSAHQLRQAHLLLSKTQDVRAAARARAARARLANLARPAPEERARALTLSRPFPRERIRSPRALLPSRPPKVPRARALQVGRADGAARGDEGHLPLAGGALRVALAPAEPRARGGAERERGARERRGDAREGARAPRGHAAGAGSRTARG